MFLPSAVFGAEVRFRMFVECSFMGFVLLRVVKLLLWWIMTVIDVFLWCDEFSFFSMYSVLVFV